MIAQIISFLFITASLPANFPQLPSGFSEWERYSVNPLKYNEEINLPSFTFTSLSEAPWEIDASGLQFDIARVNPYYGWARYSAQPTKDISCINKQGGIIQIEWQSHKEQSLSQSEIKDILIYYNNSLVENMLALKNSSLEKITIAGHTGYRLRCWWWYTCCDYNYHDVGAITSYYIPCEKRDWIIICANLFYNYEGSPEGTSPEETETWEFEKTYPNNITELEQAVEQTFRVK